jgi:gliding motility-associated transport system permease protein
MDLSLTRVGIIFQRELKSYFVTPLAYIFIAVFLVLSGFLTFELGSFFSREQADLLSFFLFHPWLYLILVPPLSMRLWAEERNSGNIELLMTLPLSLLDSVLGKFLAAWVFTGIALILSFPLWLTVNYLGDPDNGIIAAAYCGSWLMAGAFLAVGSCLSAATKNQVIAYVLTVLLCLLFVLTGLPMLQSTFQEIFPVALAQGLANLSLLSHFQSISRGVLDVRDILFFVMFAVCWLTATVLVLNLKKAE